MNHALVPLDVWVVLENHGCMTNTSVTELLPALRATLRTRRTERAARRRLENELAAYQTPRDINDLLLLISNQEGADADEVREVLSDNLAAWGTRRAA